MVATAEHLNPTLARLTVAFLQTLNQEQLQRAVFPFESRERFNWHYVPRHREGIPFQEMNAEQRTAAEALLQFVMSEHYEKDDHSHRHSNDC